MTMETRWFVTESWQEWRLGVMIGRVDHSTQPCVWLLVNTWVGYLTTISGNQIHNWRPGATEWEYYLSLHFGLIFKCIKNQDLNNRFSSPPPTHS